MPGLIAAGLLAAGDFGGEGIELVRPEGAEPLQPVVDIAQRGGVELIDPPRALGSDPGKTGIALDLEMLADARLRNTEFG